MSQQPHPHRRQVLYLILFLVVMSIATLAYLATRAQPTPTSSQAMPVSAAGLANSPTVTIETLATRVPMPTSSQAMPVSAAGLANSPTVTIELFSPNGFPVRNSLYVLRIGSKGFIGGIYKDHTIKTLVFTLTAAEFAALSDGDQVTVNYDYTTARSAGWLFGPLDKRQLKMSEQLQTLKHQLLSDLQALRATVTDAQKQAPLDAAIQHLSAALATDVHLDQINLHPQHGNEAFLRGKEAILSLRAFIKNLPDTMHPFDVETFMRRILYLDQGLAANALEQARTSGGQPLAIQNARSELDKGYRSEIRADFEAASDHYLKAWEYALQATGQR